MTVRQKLSMSTYIRLTVSNEAITNVFLNYHFLIEKEYNRKEPDDS